MTAEAATALPHWDLGDLYAGPQDPAVARDLEAARATAEAFATRYHGQVAGLTPAGLGEAIEAYEALSEPLGRLGSFAQLLYAGDMSDADITAFHQHIQEALTDISSHTLFFTLELNTLSQEALATALAQSPVVARYRPWIEDVRRMRDHQLEESLEKILHEKAVSGRQAFVRLFDETLAAMRFSVDGETLTETEVLDRFSHSDRTTRETAAHAFADGLAGEQRLFTLITNTLAKDKEIEDRWRRFSDPQAERHLANQVEPEVVNALVTAVRDAYPRTAHRYYAMKARWLGLERLSYWDRNAPLPEDDDTRYTWDQARTLVLDAYAAFSPDMAALGRRFFDRPWIDVGPRPGKASGAFAHPVVPSAHPYLLLNFMGRSRDVMTLAHELGHGVHQLLAAEQGLLLSDTPLTLAETASVFGEMLTFRAMLDREQDPRRRRVLLAGKVEDMLNTVVRQIAFHEFESAVHDQRRHGELSAERLGELWMEIQKTSLGPAFDLDAEYRHFWSYIPHFIHLPFYVYAYAFGDCLVNALYGVYQESDAGFAERYLAMLRAGGTLRHDALLAPFGLDARDPAFWQRGLGVLEGFIDQLAAEDAALQDH